MFEVAVCLPRMVKAVCAAKDICQRTVRGLGGYHDARGEGAPAGDTFLAPVWRRLPSNLKKESRNVSWVGVAERVSGYPGHIPIEVTDPREGEQLPDPSLGWDMGPLVFSEIGLDIAPEGIHVSARAEFFVPCRSALVCVIS